MLSKRPQPTESREGGRGFLPLAVAGVVVLLGGLYMLQRETAYSIDGDAKARTENFAGETRGDAKIRDVSDKTPRTGSATDSSSTDGKVSGLNGTDGTTATEEQPERTQEYPFGFLSYNFRDYQLEAFGYKMDGVMQDVNGISLPATDEETTTGEFTPRIGSIESPSLPLNQQSNAVQPMWKAELPEGTSVQVEVSLSPDQESWSQWHPIEPTGDLIEPTFPDGRPNETYGFITGSMIANGLDLYPYVKYRVTMASSVGESPVLTEFRLFHVDTTDGMGNLAEINPSAPAPPVAE